MEERQLKQIDINAFPRRTEISVNEPIDG